MLFYFIRYNNFHKDMIYYKSEITNRRGVFNMDKIYKHSINFRLRNIAGNKILLGNEKAYTLNDTAVIIWNNINGRKIHL